MAVRTSRSLPKCQDDLSSRQAPGMTPWRARWHATRQIPVFDLGMVIALLNTMPSPRDAIHRGAGHGFTLLEIMVVIAIISLLTTGVAVGALRMLRDAEDDQAKNNASAIASVAEAFVIVHRSQSCPTPEELKRDGLLSGRSKVEDPWGTPYRIQCEPDYAIAISAGRDGIFDTSDDVRSDEP